MFFRQGRFLFISCLSHRVNLPRILLIHVAHKIQNIENINKFPFENGRIRFAVANRLMPN